MHVVLMCVCLCICVCVYVVCLWRREFRVRDTFTRRSFGALFVICFSANRTISVAVAALAHANAYFMGNYVRCAPRHSIWVHKRVSCGAVGAVWGRCASVCIIWQVVVRCRYSPNAHIYYIYHTLRGSHFSARNQLWLMRFGMYTQSPVSVRSRNGLMSRCLSTKTNREIYFVPWLKTMLGNISSHYSLPLLQRQGEI